jgi:hypothetical protein
MKKSSNSNFSVEEIMTPRSLLHCVEKHELASAQKIAEEKKYDAVPIIERGSIRLFWSSQDRSSVRITKEHRLPHDTPIEDLLPRFKARGVQFVYYRTEVVGLVDMSDLNKPLARLVWLHPMLECEQKIIEQTAKLGIDEDKIAEALGNISRAARKRQRKASTEDLKLPLLSFVHFRDVLRAGTELGIISLSELDRDKLNGLRNRLAHPGHNLLEHKGHCDELIWAKKICERILKELH